MGKITGEYKQFSGSSWLIESINGGKAWTMSKNEVEPYQIENFEWNKLNNADVFSMSSIKPVINLNKCALDDSDLSCIDTSSCVNIKKYNEYKVCDEIEYNGDNYYVIDNSNGNKKYVTLLKKNPLSISEIENVSTNDEGKIVYYDYIKMGNKNFLEHWNRYEYYLQLNLSYNDSIVKRIVDNWVNNEINSDDLVEVNGYKARILDFNLYGEYNFPNFNSTESWTMGHNNDNWNTIYNFYDVVEQKNVRPLINVKKSKIENVNNLQKGDKVTYNNEDYYVVIVSNDDYVTLLKDKPLTQQQINKYSGMYLVNYENALNITNSWSKKIENDLIEVKNFKVGLISEKQLFDNLGYEYCFIGTDSAACKTDATPSCIDSEYWYWTSVNGDNDKKSYSKTDILGVGPYARYWSQDSKLTIRPVINLDKCALDGGCYEEQIGDNCTEITETDTKLPEKEPENTKKASEIVEMENTLKNISYVVIIFGILLIIGGYILYRRIKVKKIIDK